MMKENSKKIQISICTGTLCHVMGGSNLPGLKSMLPEHIAEKVEIRGSICMDACKDKSKKPPFVKIDDVLMEAATVEKIIAILEEKTK